MIKCHNYKFLYIFILLHNLLFLLIYQHCGFTEDISEKWEKARSLIQEGKLEEGWKYFEDVLINNPKDPEVLLAGGCLQYYSAEKFIVSKQQDEAKKALENAQNHFNQAILLSVDSDTRAKALYNKGNLDLSIANLYLSNPQSQSESIHHLENAIRSYREALEENPKLDVARKNLDYANYLLKQVKKNKQEEKQDKQNQENNNNQQQQLMTMFTEIHTDLPNAEAKVMDKYPNIVELRNK